MSINNANDYADSLLKSIEAACESGYPFGIVNQYTDDYAESFDDIPEEDRGEYGEASGIDYLSDVLDIEYIVNSDRTYKAARVLIAFGGPNAWINTQTGNLEVAWWGEPVYRSLPSEFVRGLDDALEELYNC